MVGDAAISHTLFGLPSNMIMEEHGQSRDMIIYRDVKYHFQHWMYRMRICFCTMAARDLADFRLLMVASTSKHEHSISQCSEFARDLEFNKIVQDIEDGDTDLVCTSS